MPMIPLPSQPTNPSLGQSSTAISGGVISPEMGQFINVGGSLVTQDPDALNIAGRGRLGRFLYLKPQGEQLKIIEDVKRSRLNEYVNQRLGEGYSRVSEGLLRRQENGGYSDINIDWNTGNIEGKSVTIPQLSSSGRGGGFDEVDAYLRQQKQLAGQAATQSLVDKGIVKITKPVTSVVAQSQPSQKVVIDYSQIATQKPTNNFSSIVAMSIPKTTSSSLSPSQKLMSSSASQKITSLLTSSLSKKK